MQNSVLDGVELSDYPWNMAEAGIRKPEAPIIHGSNRDDGNTFVHDVEQLSSTCTEDELRAYIGEVYSFDSAVVDTVVGLYSGSNIQHPTVNGNSKWWWAADRIETDFAYTCPARRASRWFAQDEGRQVFLYEWAWQHKTQFVTHGQEVPYVFDNTDSVVGASNLEVAEEASSWWSNFAKFGNPVSPAAAAAGVSWPPYEFPEGGDAQVKAGARGELFWAGPALSQSVTVEYQQMHAQCDFWDVWWKKKFGKCVPNVPKATETGRDDKVRAH